MNVAPPTSLAVIDLLHTACELLRDDVLPNLPPAQKHAGLMIQNALDIVGRELQIGGQMMELERSTMAHLLPFLAANETRPMDALVLGLRRRLSWAIRSGEFDTEEAQLLQTMRTLVRMRCGIDSPKAIT